MAREQQADVAHHYVTTTSSQTRVYTDTTIYTGPYTCTIPPEH